MGKSRCRCGGNKYETVDITPVGLADKRCFTRCSRCGLVVAVSNCQSPVKETSPQSFLHLFRSAWGNSR